MVCENEDARGVTCSHCKDFTSLFGLLYVAPYQAKWARRGIHWFKYKGVIDVHTALAHLLIERLLVIAPYAELSTHYSLVPIPLHPKKERLRGFNQSLVLATTVSHLTGIPVTPLLQRARNTHTQAMLPHDMRAKNMSQAFSVTESITPHSKFIVIDDVSTTGVTLSMAGYALQEAGAGDVWGAVIARG